jgi:hypothetical protein
MGEVYRGRDTRLHRDVALKILPEAFARDPDRLVRFEREARVLASLNDPNIARSSESKSRSGVQCHRCEIMRVLVQGMGPPCVSFGASRTSQSLPEKPADSPARWTCRRI